MALPEVRCRSFSPSHCQHGGSAKVDPAAVRGASNASPGPAVPNEPNAAKPLWADDPQRVRPDHSRRPLALESAPHSRPLTTRLNADARLATATATAVPESGACALSGTV